MCCAGVQPLGPADCSSTLPRLLGKHQKMGKMDKNRANFCMCARFVGMHECACVCLQICRCMCTCACVHAEATAWHWVSSLAVLYHMSWGWVSRWSRAWLCPSILLCGSLDSGLHRSPILYAWLLNEHCRSEQWSSGLYSQVVTPGPFVLRQKGLLGYQDGSKGICCQAWQIVFDSWDP